MAACAARRAGVGLLVKKSRQRREAGLGWCEVGETSLLWGVRVCSAWLGWWVVSARANVDGWESVVEDG